MNDEVKQEIIYFLQQEKPDVEKAAELIQKHGTNKSEVRVFISSPGRYLMQMRWALAKLCGISLVDFQKGIFDDFRKKDEKDYPAVIMRIKEELPLIFNQRTEVQKELVELGEANDEETKEKAITLGEIAEALGVRHQLLQEAKELFFDSKGEVIPNEEELFPEEVSEDEDNQETKAKVYDWAGDPIEALKKKGNLVSGLTKDRNLLKYQSKSSKNNPENPMPEGPEKDKVVARIAEKEKELEAIIEFLKPKDDTDKTE
ncbi:hypothetical protein E9993_14735 [Labilibacter sediminis]|nr:hypothetical protein E9993_14735 [Labilibacter sediminis]